MRALIFATLFFAIPVAAADPPKQEPTTRGNEVIEIHDHLPVKVPAKPQNFRPRKLPPYSEKAVLQDAWTRAWMLLDIDATGTVRRFKWVNRPGYDLEPIAVDQVFKLHFDPALDANGNTMASEIIWGIEWPSHGWIAMFTGGLGTAWPADRGFPARPASAYVPCRGSGPLNLSSYYPVYKDCSMPNIKAIPSEAWVSRPPAP